MYRGSKVVEMVLHETNFYRQYAGGGGGGWGDGVAVVWSCGGWVV